MTHPNAAAASVLDRAATDIAARLYDIAETRLATLLRALPDFPEAWNKRATLYYLLERGTMTSFETYIARCNWSRVTSAPYAGLPRSVSAAVNATPRYSRSALPCASTRTSRTSKKPSLIWIPEDSARLNDGIHEQPLRRRCKRTLQRPGGPASRHRLYMYSRVSGSVSNERPPSLPASSW